MKKKVKVHLLPTEKAKLYIDGRKLYYSPTTMHIPVKPQPQHLYFTSDEKIVLGDYYYRPGFKEIFRGSGFTKKDRKVIASSEKLNDVAQIPQSFINQYVEVAGKIDEVEIDLTDLKDLNLGWKHE